MDVFDHSVYATDESRRSCMVRIDIEIVRSQHKPSSMQVKTQNKPINIIQLPYKGVIGILATRKDKS